MENSMIIRPTYLLLVPWTIATILGTFAGIIPPHETAGQRGILIVLFGSLAVASILAFGDKVSFEGPLPTVTTRRWGFVRHTFEVPALLPKDFRVLNILAFPVGIFRTIQIPGHRMALWMYAGRQRQIIDRLRAVPVQMAGTSTRPASTGRSRRQPDSQTET